MVMLPLVPVDKRLKTLAVCILIMLTGAAYAGVLSHQFVLFDDPQYITENPFVRSGVNKDSLRWAFSFHDDSFWHPLTWISLMCDYQLVGQNPSWFHCVNVVIHALSAITLFFILCASTGRVGRSFLVAALFAVHPLNVESVAWAAERKNVLSGFFFFLTILAYLFYARRPGLARYLLVCFLFLLGLAAKSMIVALPIILLAMDFWPLGRQNRVVSNSAIWGKGSSLWLVIEKLPLLLLSCASVVVSLVSVSGNHLFDARNMLPMAYKVANALLSYAKYLGLTLWPSGLAVYYPVRLDLSLWQVIGCTAVIAIISAVALWTKKEKPWLLVGWIWYLLALLPVIGLIRRGLWPAMADRYAYLGLVGIGVALIWESCELVEKVQLPPALRRSMVVVLLLILTFACRRQVAFWHDSGTLFSHAVHETTDNDIAWANLGWYLFSEGQYDQAMPCFAEAARIDPAKADLEYAQAALHYNAGNYRLAAEWYEKALRRNPKQLASLYFLGQALERTSDYERAAQAYFRLLDTDGLDPKQYRNKGRFRLTSVLHPLLRSHAYATPVTLASGADLLFRAGMVNEAVSLYNELQGRDEIPAVLLARGESYRRAGDLAHAEQIFSNLLAKDGKNCGAMSGIAKILIGRGDWPGVQQALQGREPLTHGCGEAAFDLAFAYYAQGEWEKARLLFRGIEDRIPDFQFQASLNLRRLESFRKWELL